MQYNHAMNIAEARELVERHAANQRRMAAIGRALQELKPEFSEAKTTSVTLTVRVGPMEPTAMLEIPKKLATVIFTDELARLAKDQEGIEQRLGGVA